MTSEKWLNAGADKVAINTAALLNPDLVKQAAERFGSQCIVVAVDAKQVSGKHEEEEMGNLYSWRTQGDW